jgi:transketolase
MGSNTFMDNSWLRRKALESIYHAKSGHPGGVLSCIDIIEVLFSEIMQFNINDLKTQNRDRFILSKGHSAPALYAVAAKVGLIEESRLNGLRKINHEMQAHTHRGATPWVEASTGSLGQGFSFAIGEALGLRLKSIQNRVYVMIGDGETQEGEIWEGAMFAAHHKISNMCAILDYNKLQSDDWNKNIMGLEPLIDKWVAFGWNVIEIDGHDISEIKAGFKKANSEIEKPTMIVAHTVKGKGVSFMENAPTWHGSVKLSDEDFKAALIELGASEVDIEMALDG